jgi:hypothetical protein
MAQAVVARCYDLQDAAEPGCGKSYRLSGLSDFTGVGHNRIGINENGQLVSYTSRRGAGYGRS